ncbi:MAG: hypothetical protein Q8835_02945, partial [Sweet potato little leaf phytoplasma]|nr:hypothetical protein [Sweet potato little leaf phytoplasma]
KAIDENPKGGHEGTILNFIFYSSSALRTMFYFTVNLFEKFSRGHVHFYFRNYLRIFKTFTIRDPE